jgi:hypothetical protein
LCILPLQTELSLAEMIQMIMHFQLQPELLLAKECVCACALFNSPIAAPALIGKRMQMIVHSFTQKELSLAESIPMHFPTKHIKL